MAAVFALAATAAQAQTTCTDPVAHIVSPTPGSTLPAGNVTFTWCIASGDHFLDIESVPGAHNIFYAFTVGVDSVTLGTACAATSPTGCIPTNGETLYVTLWTNIAQSGRKDYVAAPTVTYMASNSTPAPALTTTTVGNPSVTFSSSAQSVALTATVAAASAVDQGSVTFQVMNAATNNGSAGAI
jgi:hypothetical protein